MKIVVALGGNALQSGSGPATAQAQLEVVKKTCGCLAEIIAKGHDVLVVHGNGPQVGRIHLASETADSVTPAMPFDVCGAMSQGYIGYHIQQAMGAALASKGVGKPAVSVVTQVVVDKNDAGFKNPAKPIGVFYSKEEAEALAKEKGYAVKEDSGRGWRRVIASPRPVRIVELPAIKALFEAGAVVVSCGGGGIPVAEDGGALSGVAAVIDKDFAAEKLAEDMGVDMLVILTEVEKVAVNFGKPDQKNLDSLTPAEAKKYIAEGHFAPGSMLPKVEAAVKFVEASPGKKAVITALDSVMAALEGKTGTHFGG